MTDFSSIHSLDELFSEWKTAHQNEPDETYNSYRNTDLPINKDIKNMFFPDGILCEEKFFELQKQGKSVLFVGKEANEYAKDRMPDFNPDFWLKKVAFGKEKAAPLSRGIAMLANAYYDNNYTVPNKNHDILQSIAFINLNKRGGSADCNENTLEGYVKEYSHFLYKEIELIHPDIIICCGKNLRNLVVRYLPFQNTDTIFSVYHPSYRISDLKKLQQLERCIKTMSSTHR